MAAPSRPVATVVSIDHETRIVTVSVSGAATVFRAELFDMDANIVASNEIAAPGNLTVTVPSRGVSYSLVVIAGDSSFPVNWSQPGLAIGIVIRPTEEAAVPEAGVGLIQTPSSNVENAGPMGAGLAFPFRFSSTTGAPQTNYGIDHVVDGMKQILLTRTNGRFIRREFGSVIGGKLFAPDTKLGPDVSGLLQTALAEFEHRAEVTGVVFKRDRAKGALYADIKFRTFRTHQNGNLVYPFSMAVQS